MGIRPGTQEVPSPDTQSSAGKGATGVQLCARAKPRPWRRGSARQIANACGACTRCDPRPTPQSTPAARARGSHRRYTRCRPTHLGRTSRRAERRAVVQRLDFTAPACGAAGTGRRCVARLSGDPSAILHPRLHLSQGVSQRAYKNTRHMHARMHAYVRTHASPSGQSRTCHQVHAATHMLPPYAATHMQPRTCGHEYKGPYKAWPLRLALGPWPLSTSR